MPQHVPFPSVDALLDPSELSRALGRPATSVATVAIEGGDTSTDARFFSVAIDDEPTPSLFLKIVDSDRDWLAMITADDRHRAVTVWSEGVIDRMPPEVDAAVIACADWDDGYAVLMPNLHSDLLAPGVPMSVRGFDALLDAMAAMHATFWGDPALPDEALGLCSAEAFLSHTSPGRAAEHRRRLDSWVFDLIDEGWDRLPAIMDPALVRELRALNDDPAPITAALQAGPSTLVHSDIRPANVAIGRRGGVPRVSFIDWGRPLATVSSIDLGYLLGWTALERPYPVEEAVRRYDARLRQRLGERVDVSSWESVRDIGILGGLLNTICFQALSAHGDDRPAAAQARALTEWEPWLRRVADRL
ncbi:phosphotransferase [Agromyces sp. SYSU T00194]|uniref:phosphotransferase n=1 Tax=Agromyces chitinivorans TaxID=3158560 RepID=UPI003392FEB4